MLKFRSVAQKDLGTYRCRTPSDHKIIFRLILDVTNPVSSEKIGKQIFFLRGGGPRREGLSIFLIEGPLRLSAHGSSKKLGGHEEGL